MSGKLVMGNWKMNGRLDSNRKLIKAMLEDAHINRDGVAIAAPHAYLMQLSDLLAASPMAIAAQDMSQFGLAGAYTGEVSAGMLHDIGCRYALIGHSERRQYLSETTAVLNQKLINALEAGITPVLCVGETLQQREAGDHLTVIRDQLDILAQLAPTRVIVAYEPIWAIGTGKVATLDQIREMHTCIKQHCRQTHGGAEAVRVLYGGSVKADNADATLAIDNVDGALVGGASLDVESFGIICQACLATYA
ncbi:triose-phosphate isomerase [Paludibacterium purpuratum]|uniref:Triosephosphate isomerase n=1 Tax=Paludibacterium purpuratum TaxID=1144873 RepID=A0A4R7B3Q6_9NEIS|nr:triose-phosphate isomerase [Paludibacterium purpuratum]TDR76615.1 triosephosphate isomerase [Paludibacterium purpuratum]